MRQNNLWTKILNKIKMKRLQIYKGESGFYEITSTKYGEPVLIGIVDSSEDSLTVQLLYTDTLKFYRATFLGNFIADRMVIGDIRVLDGPSYSPKFKKPYSKGYGSVLMLQALKAAKERNIKEVIGDMVSFDEKQKNRQINYYSKFGFTIDSQNQLLKLL